MLWRLCRRAPPVLAALLLGACSKDGQRTLDLSEQELDPDVLPQCQVDEREIGLDEATPIGATANDLLRWVAGAHSEPLLWLAPGGAGDSYARLAGFGPEQGSSQLQLEVEPIGARLLARSPLDEASADRCLTSLGLDVNLHLSTAGGALDERIQTTLEATRADFVTLQALYLPIDSLQGSFTAQISVKQGFDYSDSPRLWLSLTLSEAGVTGKLVLVTLVNNGRAEFGSVPKIARFPEELELCEDSMYLAATDHSVDGVSRDAVLQQLNGASPALLDGGSATMELEYTGVGARACVQPGSAAGPTTLLFPATTRLHSSDGRVDGSVQTTLWGEASSGALHSRAAARSELSDPAAAAAAAPSYALLDPIDFSGFDGGSFEFQADVDVASGSGSLIVNGVSEPKCSAVTSYGAQCTRASRTELWAARWSKRQ
jgi:hypothetical protein